MKVPQCKKQIQQTFQASISSYLVSFEGTSSLDFDLAASRFK
jgi:hypothetical protein